MSIIPAHHDSAVFLKHTAHCAVHLPYLVVPTHVYGGAA